MAKSYNQKVKILYLEKMLRESGEDRVVTMQEILTKLLECGIQAERKSIYDDIEALRSFGMDVKFRRGRPGGYYLAGQKACKPASEEAYRAGEAPFRAEETSYNPEEIPFRPQVALTGSKDAPESESVELDAVQALDAVQEHGTMQGQSAVQDQGAEQLRRESGENFAEAVHKKAKAQSSEQEWSFGKDAGSGKQMKLLCDNSVRKNVEAYLGKKAQYKEKGLGYFTAAAGISEGPQFYGWLTSMGSKVHILKPKKTAQGYREYLKALVKEYKGV